MAAVTAILSYPLTALHLCKLLWVSQPPVATESGSVTLCILGAETAEVEHLQVWELFAAAVAVPVCLQFIGPGLEEGLHNTSVPLGKGSSCVFWKGEYHSLLLKVKQGKASGIIEGLLRAPRALLGFNLGLTCPDYKWEVSLRSLKRAVKKRWWGGGLMGSLPLLLSSNTYVEADMELELLRDLGWQATARPVRCSGAGGGDARDSGDPKCGSACGSGADGIVEDEPFRNPFHSFEILQSGTLGNDVYRKNSWLTVSWLQ